MTICGFNFRTLDLMQPHHPQHSNEETFTVDYVFRTIYFVRANNEKAVDTSKIETEVRSGIKVPDQQLFMIHALSSAN